MYFALGSYDFARPRAGRGVSTTRVVASRYAHTHTTRRNTFKTPRFSPPVIITGSRVHGRMQLRNCFARGIFFIAVDRSIAWTRKQLVGLGMTVIVVDPRQVTTRGDGEKRRKKKRSAKGRSIGARVAA